MEWRLRCSLGCFVIIRRWRACTSQLQVHIMLVATEAARDRGGRRWRSRALSTRYGCFSSAVSCSASSCSEPWIREVVADTLVNKVLKVSPFFGHAPWAINTRDAEDEKGEAENISEEKMPDIFYDSEELELKEGEKKWTQ